MVQVNKEVSFPCKTAWFCALTVRHEYMASVGDTTNYVNRELNSKKKNTPVALLHIMFNKM